MEYSFRKLQLSDVSLVHCWFNLPHVQKFYSLRSWVEEEVLKKLEPYILGIKPVYPFIILINEQPVGYIQYYPVRDFPWPNQDLPQDVVQQSAGMDLFIGEPQLLHKGHGQQIIRQFLKEKIWRHFNYCVVDPEINNQTAIDCYKKLGFANHKIISSENALQKKVKLQLMILNKNH